MTTEELDALPEIGRFREITLTREQAAKHGITGLSCDTIKVPVARRFSLNFFSETDVIGWIGRDGNAWKPVTYKGKKYKVRA